MTTLRDALAGTLPRTSMVKIALRKLFAGILCGCVVLLVLVAKWVREKKPSKPIHILTELFTTRIHKENKQVLPYQRPRENFGQHNLLYVYLSACWKNRTEIMQEQTWWKLRCASCLLVFCAVVWYCLLVAKWVREKKHPNLSIF